MKATHEHILSHIARAARVFVFDASDFLEDIEDAAIERIQEALFASLPGCKEIGGPYYNGVMAVTVEDENTATDEAVRSAIAEIIQHAIEEAS